MLGLPSSAFVFHKAPIELFENDDKDGDGFVSFDEFGGPKGQGA